MKLEDFDFELPEDRIATRPASPRSSARLLYAKGNETRDLRVTDLPDLLRPGDMLVLNDTKVIPARLEGVRRRMGPDGAVIEARVNVTLMAPEAAGGWTALARPLRKLRPGDTLDFGDGFTAQVRSVGTGQATLDFDQDGEDFEAALARSGAMPLPPYIAAKRPADARDLTDYQTVWARNTGAVAAPTASLHFDEPLLSALRARGVGMTFVTLHVGAGTFLPVKVDDVKDHRMHAETGDITPDAARAINAARAAGGRIIPVGTTALRVLETAATADGRLAPWSGATEIFIYPGYSFRMADGLMTNFHLPKSTLMMLVSALMGKDRIMDLYAHAIREHYRFFSYGDASLLIPEG
ncbi:MAG: tRNA preQ1(34) S-adenosylmethionine ribosyltransferase-isomerase QueA [Pseudomonadota bacterium]